MKLIDDAMQYGARRIKEEMATEQPYITLADAYRSMGRKMVDRGLENGTLKTVKKGGKTSKVYIMREHFERWILLDELSNEPVTK